MVKNKLNEVNFGLALGIIWAFGVLFLGLSSWLINWGSAFVTVLSSLYIGYKSTLLGSIIGMVWAFFDGFFGGLIFALIYNWLEK